GIIAFLARARQLEPIRDRADRLLGGAVQWLLGQRLPGEVGAMFPRTLGPSPLLPGGPSWCYGDPGIASALLLAAQIVRHSDWERAALDVAHRAVRHAAEHAGFLGVSLCHGTAGIAHIFNRVFHMTDDQLFKQASQRWYAHTLDLMITILSG